MKYILAYLIICLSIAVHSEDIKDILKQNAVYRQSISVLQNEINTLSGQIEYLNNDLDKLSKKNEDLYKQKADLMSKIIKLTEDEYYSWVNIESQKQEVQKQTLDLFRVENRHTNSNSLDYRIKSKLARMTRAILEFNISTRQEIWRELNNLSDMKAQLELIKLDISKNWNSLNENIKAKNELLAYSKWKEEYFQNLIELNKTLMLKSLQKLQSSRKQIAVAEKKIVITKRTDPYDLTWIKDEWPLLSWPVNPKWWIDAGFRDSNYKSIFWIEHIWIDIKVNQGTSVKAAQNWYVYEVYDWWMNYSYVILVHRWSLQTVYGHLSKITVKQGAIVLKGDEIWLSGGMPGTPGAGPMTTWPHLHLEVHKDWQPVDPMEYLKK